MKNYCEAEIKLRKAHLAILRKEYEEADKKPIGDDYFLAQSWYYRKFEEYLIGQPWKVMWPVIKGRWAICLTGIWERLAGPARRFRAAFKWRVREVGLKRWGVDAKQTLGIHGVIMPSGRFVRYGTPYRWLFFLGRIRNP